MPLITSTTSINYYAPLGLSPHTTFLAYGIALILAVIGLIIVINTWYAPSRASIANLFASISISTAILIALFFINTAAQWQAPVFAPKTMLASLWENYTEQYLDPTSHRTVDPSRGDITTSEGESYTMLRAVWMDDKTTFDESWSWTQANLQKSNNLFAWLYGTRPNGKLGILTNQNGQTSATDADEDIALALTMAYSRWQDPKYLTVALPIIHSMWQDEVFISQHKPYLAPDDAASMTARYQILDVSYLAPYAYRIFANVDPTDDWNGLITTSYALLQNSMAATLDDSTTAELPPDWVVMNTATGALSAPIGNASETTDFGYDAIRAPYRLALDWEWFGDPRDKTILDNMSILTTAWQTNHLLDATYHHDGTPSSDYETPAMYGGTIGYFMIADPSDAQAVYDQKLVSLYSPDTGTWYQPLDYYDANIAWFGMALYNHDLPNLFALNGPSNASNTETLPQNQ